MFGAEKIMVLRVLVINSSEMTPAAVPFTKGFSSLYCSLLQGRTIDNLFTYMCICCSIYFAKLHNKSFNFLYEIFHCLYRTMLFNNTTKF